MTTRFRRRHLLLTTGMTLLLGACGGASTPAATSAPNGAATAPAQNPTPGSGTAAPSTKPPSGGGTATGGSVDPCSLLTQAEVDTAVGQPLGPGNQSLLPGECSWTTTDVTAGVDVQVSDWAQTKTAATAPGIHPISVSGVGDEALYHQGNLYVRKGDAGFLVSIFGPHIDFSKPDGGLAQAKVLAAAILGRL
jgi:hypothetical protein